MHKNSVLLVATLVMLVLLALFGIRLRGELSGASVAVAATAAPPAQATMPRTIIVVGEGQVTAKPDIATATVGVEVTAATVKEATSEAASRMEKIMAALKQLGVAEKDIRTSNYSITYETRYPIEMPAVEKGTQTPEQAGFYRVSNMISLKIRDLTKVGQIVDEVVNAGANSIWGISFGLDDTSQIEAEARAKAVANAKARAEELAKLSNVKLGPIIEVSEVIGSSPFAVQYAMETVRIAGGGAGPISPGELEVSKQVQITFAIE